MRVQVSCRSEHRMESSRGVNPVAEEGAVMYPRVGARDTIVLTRHPNSPWRTLPRPPSRPHGTQTPSFALHLPPSLPPNHPPAEICHHRVIIVIDPLLRRCLTQRLLRYWRLRNMFLFRQTSQLRRPSLNEVSLFSIP